MMKMKHSSKWKWNLLGNQREAFQRFPNQNCFERNIHLTSQDTNCKKYLFNHLDVYLEEQMIEKLAKCLKFNDEIQDGVFACSI